MPFKKVQISLLVTALCFLVLPLHPAGLFAEEPATDQPAADQNEEDISVYHAAPITVTAEKREENIQEVPVSVTAFSETQIEDAGIADVGELQTYIPNLSDFHFGPRGGSESHLLIRGVGSLLGDSSVGFYVDDVSYLSGVSFNMTDFYDIERIEFLRGPQGTLYGRNALGGVINIITKKPTNDFDVRAGLSFGDYDYRKYHARLNVPVVMDKLFFSLSGSYSERDGFVENDLSGETVDFREGFSGRAKLRWMPSDSLDITLGVSGDRIRDGSYAIGPLEEIRENPYHVRHNFTDGYSDADQTREDLRVVYKTPGFTITSITGLLQHSLESMNDQDFTPNDFALNDYKKDTDQITQELRFSSPDDNDSPWKWIGGAYLYRKDMNIDFDDIFRPDAYNFMSGGALSPLGLEIESHDILTGDIDTYGGALFGQVTYTVFDKLDLTAGIRLEYEKSEAKLRGDREVVIGGPGAPMLPLYLADPVAGPQLAPLVYEGPTSRIDEDVDYSEWLPKFTVAYHLDEDVMTYATAAKGFRSGGFNMYLQGSDDPDDLIYGPEYSWNYELGIKSGWFDNRLIANAAVFYIDYEDQQVLQLIGASQTITRNAAKSTSKGFEIELAAKPVQGLELIANYGYTDAAFDEYRDPKAGVVYDDNKVLMVPEHDYLLAAQYRYALNPSLTLFSRVELHGVGELYWDYANSEKQGAYELVNARIGAEFEHFDVYFWVKNLFEQEYETIAFEFPLLGWLAQPGNPRTIGLTLNGRF